MPHLAWPPLPQLQHRQVRYGSVCSGIEAATVAWHVLPGWRPLWFSQFDPEHNYDNGPDFPSAVLADQFPGVMNLGDMTADDWMQRAAAMGDIDVLVGGCPCQDFSVAGLRAGLHGDRGQLTLRYCEIANAANPAFVLYENVPGILSDKTNGFGCLLAGLAGEDVPLVPPGGRWTDAGVVSGPQRTIAWRILDAQYSGLAQRRRRVFALACPRTSGIDPCAVLFEFDSMRRDSPPSRATGEAAPAAAEGGAGGAGLTEWASQANRVYSERGVSPTVQGTGSNHGHRPPNVLQGVDLRNGQLTGDVAMTLQAGQAGHSPDPGGTPHLLQPVPIMDPQRRSSGGGGSLDRAGLGIGGGGDPMFTLGAERPHGVFVKTHRATSPTDAEIWREGEVAPTVTATERDHHDGQTQAVVAAAQVRRLTPTECERLQGFPDGWTRISWRGKPAADCPDGPRYKTLGNSMAVPVMRFIGLRMHIALTTPQLLELKP